MPQGSVFSPFEIAKAYRDEFPGKFDDLDDYELVRAIKEVDPDTAKLIDPLLEGAEILAPMRRAAATAPPAPLPTPPPQLSTGDVIATTGMRVVPAVAGAMIGSLPFFGGPGVGTYAGGAIGSGLGETAAQAYEKAVGPREAFSPGSIALESALGAVNPAARGVTIGRRVAQGAGVGALLGGGGTVGRSVIERGELPGMGEVALGTALGGGFGAATQGVVEGVGALGRMAPSFGDATGALPTGVQPPRTPLPLDLPPPTGFGIAGPDWVAAIEDYNAGLLDPALARAVSAQYAAEEAAMAAELKAKFGEGALRGQTTDLHTALIQRAYLARIATLSDAERAIAASLQPPPTGIEGLGTPFAPPSGPLRLPAAAGPGQAGPPVGPFAAYPADAIVEPLGAGVGAAPPPLRTDLAAPPPAFPVVGGVPPGNLAPSPTAGRAFEQALATTLNQPPGPPRLVRPLVLSSSEIPPSVPRGMDALIAAPPPDFDQPIQQGARVGGRQPSETQPRIPGVLEPGYDRPYATGPNAGPRRPPRQELHGAPRPIRRQVRTGKVVRYETAPSTLRAEDPGTYPPEVRRELAAMAWELDQFRHERVQGGISRAMIDDLVESGAARDASEAIAQLRRSGASSGGAIAGAPVYHQVRDAAQGSFQHITREGMLQQIRAALLEGKGTGLTDAAAQVARTRLAERARGPVGKRSSIIANRGDEGDALIGWVDETGARALPEQDLAPEVRQVREMDDGEIWATLRIADELGPDVNPDTLPFFQAARNDAVRRGLIRPEQLDLRMEGPGGAGGPKLTDFVGEPPPPKPSQPELPGTEGVRQTEIPTPEVAEAPFALTPPPPKPARAGYDPRKQRSLLEQFLEDEEGVVIFRVPAGDRVGLRKWLRDQDAQHGGEAWHSRAEQAVADGDWDKAWKIAASASVRSYAQALTQAKTREQQARIQSAIRGTPLQDDLNAQLIAQARQQAGVGTAPPVKDFPPSTRTTQAGAARGRATLGPAGILNPGLRQRPLSSAAPALRAATLDREVVRLITEGIEEVEGLATVPGNTDTYLRLFRQVGDQIYQGKNLKLLRDAGVRLPPEELAQHWNATISDAGRTLQLLSSFAQAHREVLTEAAERMSMGGALRGMLGGPPVYTGARGRVASPAGQIATQEVIDEIADRTSRYQAAAMKNDLQKRTPVGPLRALHDASYAWMLSKWNTAVRNYVSFTGRYSVDSLDHALTIPLAQLSGDTPTADLSSALLRERGLTPFRRGTAVTPKQAWADDLQGIYDFTTDNLNALKPNDARRAIRLLLDVPEQAAHFMGAMTGEDLSQATANIPVLRHLTNPKVQRFLTMFNRAQEFSARATVFDATTRALLRARGLDPTDVLQRTTPEIIQAVGGQQAFEDLLFTATSQALEATFAGRTAKDSLPGALIRFINEAWPLKLGTPFPRFNFSAAPRWIYDHSPAALLDLVRFPLDRAGITAPKGTAAGGRLYRGVRAQEIQRVELPALQLKIGQAERRQGEALQELLGTQREFAVRQRQITRLEKRATEPRFTQVDLLSEARTLQSQLAQRRERLKATVAEQKGVVTDLKSEQQKLLTRVVDATAINAPNYAQYLARMATGTVGMLGAAWVVRAQEGAQGTRWYEYRIDRGEGKDPIILDFRPFAPFAQYLFVADVLHDFMNHTDWEGVRTDVGTEEEGLLASPLDWSRAIWNRYEGKYTEQELGAQFAQAFLSISRAAGTTLTITDLLTQNGWPSLDDAGRALVGTVGQFLSRFTVPGQQISDIATAPFSREEAKIRVPPRATIEDWERPLAAPFANVPFVKQLIPERISQTTGRPVAAEYPLLRGLLGIGTAPRDFIVEEVQRIGVPGASVYIRETGDYGLDRLVAETYARLLQEELPAVFEDPFYTELGTPARQRDYLQRYVFPALKRASLGEARELLGEERVEEGTVRGEAARRRDRQQRLLDDLAAAEPEIAPTPDDQVGEPPPGPPGFESIPPPPGF